RHDRQRLLLLPRPARARADLELHPLRSRLCPRRSPHPGHGAGSGQALYAFRVRGRRPRRAGRRRRDPDGFLVEHYADGDMFDNTLEPGWAAMHASGLYQWGPPPSNDFLGLGSPREVASELAVMTDALRHDNEFDLSALRGLFAVANS